MKKWIKSAVGFYSSVSGDSASIFPEQHTLKIKGQTEDVS
jgi:hypothetical protein